MPMTPIIWLNLLLCIISEKNKTFPIINLDTSDEIVTCTAHSGTSDSFDIFDYNNFEPFDISSKESKPEITNAPHPGFLDSYDLLDHTNLDSSLGSYTDSNRNVWRDANGELETNDDILRYRDAQSETSSALNVNTDDIITCMYLPGSQQNAVPIYFHQLTLSSDGTSGQHGNAEQSNMDNKHFSDNLNVPKYRGNTNEGSETKKLYLSLSWVYYDHGKLQRIYNHTEKHTVNPSFYECKVPGCGRIFDYESSFYNHIQTHEPRPQCEDCGTFLVNRNALRKHKRLCQTKSHERSYECLYPGCAVIAKSYKEYVTHRKTHAQPFIYECKVAGCGRTFNYKSSFRSHKQTHESNPQCECCGKFFASVNILRRHKKCCQTNSREENYECLYPGCTMVTKNYNEYVTHRKTHQPFTYECRVPGCGRTFDHKASFCNHKQTHEPHPQCEYCNKFFTCKSGLQNHKRRCQTKSCERKSYECLYPGCAVIAKSYKEYVTHRKTHGQPFIYECKVPGCGRTFNYKSSLYSHKKTHEPRPRCECLANSFTV
uniref:Zinc finger, C2H2 type family protein n=1 Tax=Brugia malayi TaxID=6279 RepID=A8PV40_BRUMA